MAARLLWMAAVVGLTAVEALDDGSGPLENDDVVG